MTSFAKLFLILFFSFISYSQKRELDCDSIEKGIFDSLIYKKIKNKLILNIQNKEIYLVKTNATQYFVSKKIKDLIMECNCESVKIEKPIKRDDINAPKIVRD